MDALQPEDHLLIACCAAALRSGSAGSAEAPSVEVEPPVSKAFTWAAFVARANWHGVHGTILPVVASQLRSTMPENVWESMRELAQRQAQKNLRLSRAQAELIEAFERARVPFVVLKGLPLAQHLYGTVTARRCRDIDLLVAPEAFWEGRAVLESLGYASTRGLTRAQDRVWLRYASDLPMQRSDDVFVELHHGFEIRPARAAHACAAGLLAAARPFDLDGVNVPAALGVELIPYLAWHGTKHAWFRLFWLLDIAAVELRAGVANRDAIWEAAASIGQQRSLALAWWLSAALFGVPQPATRIGPAEAGRVAALGGRVLRDAFGPVKPLQAHTLARRSRALSWQWQVASGPGQRAAVVRDYLIAVQPDDIQAIPLPRSLYWLYPVLRPFRVVARFVKALLTRLMRVSWS